MRSMQQISKLANTFYWAYRKNWILEAWSERLDSGCLDVWTLGAWTLDNWMVGLWRDRSLDAWTLDAWTLDCQWLDAWTFDASTLDTWTLDPWTKEILSIFSNIYFFFILFNVEFSNIFKALRLMHYGSVQRVANGYYKSHPVHLILWTKFPRETTIRP